MAGAAAAASADAGGVTCPLANRRSIAFLRALEFPVMLTCHPPRHQPLGFASKRLVFSRPLFYLCLPLCGEGGCDHGRPISQLFRAISADFRGRGAVLWHHRDPRHPGEDRGVTPSSPPGRDPRRRMGEPVHAARAVAVSLDLGDGLPPRTRLGELASARGGWRGRRGQIRRAGGLAPAVCSARKEPEDGSPIME